MAIAITHKTKTYHNRQRILDHIASPLKMCVVDITFDSSYPTGGEALSVSSLDAGISNILAVIPQPSRGNSYGYILSFNPEKYKLVVLETNSDYAGDTSLTEVGNGTDLSAAVFRCCIIGY
jgi:hypothetical protein